MNEHPGPDLQAQTQEPLNQPGAAPQPRRGVGLSAKLLILTILFVLISEVLIFVPSIANFRNNWLEDRLADAELAVVALDPPSYMPPPDADTDMMMQQLLLEALGARELAIIDNNGRRILATNDMVDADRIVDVDVTLLDPLTAILDAFETLFAGDRILRIHGPSTTGTLTVETVVDEYFLRDALLVYSRNILILSIIISLITAGLVYLALNWMFVRPLRRLDTEMARFASAPEDPRSEIEPSGRGDEIGTAEMRLASMQRELRTTLSERRRLADVGLAVSKINHDLRNLLSTAQLLSDRLALSEDPTVQRVAPKVVRAIDRAVSFCEATLAYGKVREEAPEREIFGLYDLVGDAAEFAGLTGQTRIAFHNRVPPDMSVSAGQDHLFRTLLNLMRNARHALESREESDAASPPSIAVTAIFEGDDLMIEVADNGPGIMAGQRDHLFKPFAGGQSRNGSTGLGLAIAKELVTADGGTIALRDDDPLHLKGADHGGAVFEIRLPDARATVPVSAG